MRLPEFDTNAAIISEMSDDELREEILNMQRQQLLLCKRDSLLQHVVDFRMTAYRNRLMNEAEIKPKLLGIEGLFNPPDDGMESV